MQWNPDTQQWEHDGQEVPEVLRPLYLNGGPSGPPPSTAPVVAPGATQSGPSTPTPDDSVVAPTTRMFDISGLLQPWGQTFSRPNLRPAADEILALLPQLADFKAPNAPTIDPLTMPTTAEMFADPSFAGRLQVGTDAIENSAFARGVGRTGGTLKDLVNYSQQFASNEYQNLFGRKLAAHQTNAGDRFNTWDREFAGAKAEYEPNIVRYSTEANAVSRAAESELDRAWQEYTMRWDEYGDQQNQLLNLLKWKAEMGLQ